MNVVFIICAVFGTAATLGLIIMLLGFGVKVNIGFSLPKGKTIPFEQFIPRTIYGISVFVSVFGYSGILLQTTQLPMYFVIPVSVAVGMFVNFLGAHLFSPLFTKVFVGSRPAPEKIEGYEAVATENISGDGYGTVRVKYEGRSYRFDCISAYHTDIAKGETVEIITGENELLFVQKKDEIYNVVKEDV